MELAVHRLHPIGCIRDYGRWCGGPAVAFVPAALWHSKPSFASKALHFLVIDCPAFCGRCDARAETPSRMVLGVVAQPGPQRRIRIVGVQFRISQKPLERGVFTLEVVEPLDVLPGPTGSPPTAPRTESSCGESPLRRSSPRPGLVTRQPRCQQSGRAHSAFQSPVESKYYRRWKVCRTRDEQPISGGEYSLSGREQFGRQRLYPSVTI